MRGVFNMMLRRWNRSIFLVPFLMISLFPHHQLGPIFTKGLAADR
jgi:hypothetical protein